MIQSVRRVLSIIALTELVFMCPQSVDAATTSCSTVAACLLGMNTTSGPGVEGTSAGSFGIVGNTFENATSTGTARAGVLGQDLSTNKNTFNSGVSGVSKYGYGVLGQGGTYGGYFTSTTGDAIEGHSALGYGLYAQSDQNVGIVSFSLGNSDSLYSAAIGTQSGSAVHAVAGTADRLLTGTNASTQQDVVSIDSAGNAILAGTLTQSGQPLIRTRTTEGKALMSYGERSGSPILEDFGFGVLRAGKGHVKLDQAFSTAMDSRSPYMVFLSPEGNNHGLYVTAITSRNFIVRECNGGRSNLTFAYRIVAKPFDTDLPRFSPTTQFSGLRRSALIQYRSN